MTIILEFLARTRLRDREPAMVRKVCFLGGVCQLDIFAFHAGGGESRNFRFSSIFEGMKR
jgi:hypothetical protein